MDRTPPCQSQHCSLAVLATGEWEWGEDYTGTPCMLMSSRLLECELDEGLPAGCCHMWKDC